MGEKGSRGNPGLGGAGSYDIVNNIMSYKNNLMTIEYSEKIWLILLLIL